MQYSIHIVGMNKVRLQHVNSSSSVCGPRQGLLITRDTDTDRQTQTDTVWISRHVRPGRNLVTEAEGSQAYRWLNGGCDVNPNVAVGCRQHAGLFLLRVVKGGQRRGQ